MHPLRNCCSLLVALTLVLATTGCGDSDNATSPSPVGPSAGAADSSVPVSVGPQPFAPAGNRSVGSAARAPSNPVHNTAPTTPVANPVNAVRDLTAVAVYSLTTSATDTISYTWKPPLDRWDNVDPRVNHYSVVHDTDAETTFRANRCTGTGAATLCTATYESMAVGAHSFTVAPATNQEDGPDTTVRFVLAADPPTAVRNLTATQVATTNHVAFTWDPPYAPGTTTPDASVISYNIRLSLGPDTAYSVGSVCSKVGSDLTCTVTPDGHSYGTFNYELRAVNAAGGGPYTTVSVEVTEAVDALLTASFGAPSSARHRGKLFSVTLSFSENVSVGYRDVRDHVMTVTNASILRARRATRGSNQQWNLSVKPLRPSTSGHAHVAGNNGLRQYRSGLHVGQPNAAHRPDARRPRSLNRWLGVTLAGPAAYRPDPRSRGPELLPAIGLLAVRGHAFV